MEATAQPTGHYSLFSGRPRSDSDAQVNDRLCASRGFAFFDEVAVFFTGTLTNSKRLAQSLGLSAVPTPDELIALLYQEHGADVTSLVEGAYAVVIVGTDETILFRDRGNLEDLYYHCSRDGHCVIATSVRELREHMKLEVNENVLPEFLVFSNVNSHETFFKHVYSPRLDEYVRWDHRSNEWTRHVHDHLAHSPLVDSGLTDQEILDAAEAIIVESLELLVEEFPDSVMVNTLSGGIDSSLLQCFMHRTGFRDSFCLNLTGYGHDGEYSRGIADHFGANHHVIEFETTRFVENLQVGIERTEKPLVFEGEAMFVDMYEKLAHHYEGRHIVCLNGSGADAVFGHGKSLNAINYLRRAPRTARVMNLILALLSPKKSHVVAQCLDAIRDDTVHPGFLIAVTNRLPIASCVADALGHPATCSAVLRCEDANRYPVSMFERMYRTHIFRSDCLRNNNSDYKSARASNILLAFPFLERRLVQLMLNVPLQRKIRRCSKKYFARKLIDRYAPKSLTSRAKRRKGTPFLSLFQTDPGFVSLIQELKDARYPYFEFDFDDVFTRPGFEELALKLIDFHVWHKLFID